MSTVQSVIHRGDREEFEQKVKIKIRPGNKGKGKTSNP